MKIYDYNDATEDGKAKVRHLYVTCDFYRQKDSMLSQNCRACFQTKEMSLSSSYPTWTMSWE